MQKESIITVLSSVLLSVVASAVVTNQSAKAPAEVTAPAAVATQAPSDIGASIESYLKSNPKIVRESLEAAQRQEEQERQRRAEENYKNHIDELHNTNNSPFIGPKDAKITIVEFFDFNCGYCKRVAPAMMKVIENNSDVRIVLKPVAFLSQTSETAARALLAANELNPKNVVKFYEDLLTSKESISEATIDAALERAGYTVAEIKKAMHSDTVNKNFEEIADLSQRVEVRGVPTLIINGAPLRAIDYAPIQRAIDGLK